MAGFESPRVDVADIIDMQNRLAALESKLGGSTGVATTSSSMFGVDTSAIKKIVVKPINLVYNKSFGKVKGSCTYSPSSESNTVLAFFSSPVRIETGKADYISSTSFDTKSAKADGKTIITATCVIGTTLTTKHSAVWQVSVMFIEY